MSMEMMTAGATPLTQKAAPPIAWLQGVRKNYGTVQALRGVDLLIPAGEILALLGPNGAGKTTALNLLLGLATPTVGTVRVFGADPSHPEARTRIGAMLQVARIPETLRVREHIDLFSSYYPSPLPLSETLRIAGLTDLKDRLFGQLSGGQKQRVLFALAICGNPDLLLLDEPTVGLDVEARRLLWDQIRQLVRSGKTVLLTTHYLQEADALADRIVVINKGEIGAEGTPAQIKAKTAGKRIQCVTSLSTDEIGVIAGVDCVARNGRNTVIDSREPEKVIRELMSRDAALTDIEVSSAALEDAFLALTRDPQVQEGQVQ